MQGGYLAQLQGPLCFTSSPRRFPRRLDREFRCQAGRGSALNERESTMSILRTRVAGSARRTIVAAAVAGTAFAGALGGSTAAHAATNGIVVREPAEDSNQALASPQRPGPASGQPGRLDDATAARIIRIHQDQAGDLMLFQNQARLRAGASGSWLRRAPGEAVTNISLPWPPPGKRPMGVLVANQ